MELVFKLGEEASAAKLWNALTNIQLLGGQVMASVEQARVNTLIAFENRLSAINGRQLRADRIATRGSYGSFLTADFVGIDQSGTTATVRVDSSSVSLREKAQPVQVMVKSSVFTTSDGTAQAMDPNNILYRVTVTDGGTPTGTFDIELRTPLSISLLIFDMASSPSTPAITVSTSADGVTYTPAQSLSQNGYRCTAVLGQVEVRYVRISVAPTHPDDLSGTSFTFGITSLSGSGVEYALQSDFVSKPLSFAPVTGQLLLATTDTDPRLTYFLALQPDANPVTPIEVIPGEVINIPGVTVVTTSSVPFVEPTEQVFQNNLMVVANEVIRPTVPNGFIFVVTQGGMLQATGEPVWPQAAGQNVTSNNVIMFSFPDQTYLPGTEYLQGMILRPTVATGFSYVAINTGTTQASGEPTWPQVPGQQITTGSLTVQCQLDGQINHVLPANVALNTLRVLDESTQEFLRVAPDFTADPNLQFVVNPYIVVVPQEDGTRLMYYMKYNPQTSAAKTFTLSYVFGPAQITATLMVRLNTEDHSSTPVFHGAELQQV